MKKFDKQSQTLYRTFIKHLTANLIYNLSELKNHKMNLSDSFKYKYQCTQLQSDEKCDNTKI